MHHTVLDIVKMNPLLKAQIVNAVGAICGMVEMTQGTKFEFDKPCVAVSSFGFGEMAVQSALAMYPIHAFGSEEQRERFLPGMARGQIIGAFGLTEPNSGSDPGSMHTHARQREAGGDYILTGQKFWITNSPIADVMVVWAKTLEFGSDTPDRKSVV